jgi:hypothetical protein
MNATLYADAPQASRWDPALFEPLAELNEEVLAALLEPPVATELPRPGSLAWQWRGLAPEGRRRMADCPFLLLDLGLAQPRLWAEGGCQLTAGLEGVAEPIAVERRLDPGLLHRALLYAWHLTRTHRQAARLALGMGGVVADALAARRLASLEQLAALQPSWIRPRWSDRPLLWQGWLSAAAFDRGSELERLRLWGLQKLAAEVLQGPG